MTTLLPEVDPAAIARRSQPMQLGEIRERVNTIIDRVRTEGVEALEELACEHDSRAQDQPLFLTPDAMHDALASLGRAEAECLERVAERIRRFATAQRESIREMSMSIPGGTAGHRIIPLDAAGCYVPGGRYPLPSSALMTALTASVAGVESIWVATPDPAPVTLAACAMADVKGVICAGGAHAISAMAYGCGPVPACDIVVGPGNIWVTAAKREIFGQSAIDMLAGPSELVIVADDATSPALIAADLLAQAEHDPDASVVLVSTSRELIGAVRAELESQLAQLPTRAIAEQAIGNGSAVVVADLQHAATITDRLAPEHLQVMLRDPDQFVARCRHYGAAFIGSGAAEVFGDYGFGPNHVLPTGGGARQRGGLSVLDFLSIRTWMRIDSPADAAGPAHDAAALARIEGLAAHARAAEMRMADQ